MAKFVAIFTKSDTLEFLPNEVIEINSDVITAGELMRNIESQRRELSKKVNHDVLFAVVATEDGQVVNYNAHNF